MPRGQARMAHTALNDIGLVMGGISVAKGLASSAIRGTAKTVTRGLAVESRVIASVPASSRSAVLADQHALMQSQSRIASTSRVASLDLAVGKARIGYIPLDTKGKPLALPRDKSGVPLPDGNYPHTQIGWKEGRRGGYRQTRQFDHNGLEVKRTDWTNHGRSDHFNPHDHVIVPNKTGGTLEIGSAKPFEIITSIKE